MFYIYIIYTAIASLYYFLASLISKSCENGNDCQENAGCNSIGSCECNAGYYPKPPGGDCVGKSTYTFQVIIKSVTNIRAV